MGLLSAASLATLVFCAPGYPGGAGDAQPLVDQFVGAAAAAFGWPAGRVAAIYDPTEARGLAQPAQRRGAPAPGWELGGDPRGAFGLAWGEFGRHLRADGGRGLGEASASRCGTCF